jgi:uncharacterized protein GlcG (DUF336 family)
VVDLTGALSDAARDCAPVLDDNAYYKAYSAASITLGRNEGSTKEVAARMAKGRAIDPADAAAERHMRVGGATISNGAAPAIGVSGAPGGNFDEECTVRTREGPRC